MPRPDLPPDDVEIFWGRTSQNVANVFVRVAQQPAGATLSGYIQGPTCCYSRTLPGRIPLTDQGLGENLLARALLPDPCFWSPALPFLYRVQVDIVHGGQIAATATRSLGIRMFGVAGRDLRMEGKRWVARGVHGDCPPISALEGIHDTRLVACCSEPDEALCQEASRLGVMIFALLERDSASVLATARRVARWPAVAMIFLPPSTRIDRETLATFPNTPFGAIGSPPELTEPPAWAAALLAEVRRPEDAATLMATGLPVIVSGEAWYNKSSVRPEPNLVQGLDPLGAAPPDDFEFASAARAACDGLQSRLAAIGDFAGYLMNFKAGQDS